MASAIGDHDLSRRGSHGRGGGNRGGGEGRPRSQLRAKGEVLDAGPLSEGWQQPSWRRPRPLSRRGGTFGPAAWRGATALVVVLTWWRCNGGAATAAQRRGAFGLVALARRRDGAGTGPCASAPSVLTPPCNALRTDGAAAAATLARTPREDVRHVRLVALFRSTFHWPPESDHRPIAWRSTTETPASSRFGTQQHYLCC